MLGTTSPSLISFLLALGLDAGLSLLVFRHAERHGSRHATAWGVFAFLFAGIVVPLYFVRYGLRARR